MSSFPFLWRVTAGHKYLYFFYFFLKTFISLSLGVNHFCLAPSLISLDNKEKSEKKKNVCEHIVIMMMIITIMIIIISVAFWMSVAVSVKDSNLSATNSQVCVCYKKGNFEEKKS